ncbi:MAG: hypothetical protein KAS57_07095 [Gammaproteobacteria bacterium]|nr:hypothetical protein [Gammaproteobacteria bacterium]
MKITVITLSLLLPAVAFAQNSLDMNSVDMQNIMKHIGEMESCMQAIDETKMNEIRDNSIHMEAEISALCKDGKRSQAQEKAVSYGKKMMNDATMKAMIKCSEPMKGIMRATPIVPFDANAEIQDKHVCD